MAVKDIRKLLYEETSLTYGQIDNLLAGGMSPQEVLAKYRPAFVPPRPGGTGPRLFQGDIGDPAGEQRERVGEVRAGLGLQGWGVPFDISSYVDQAIGRPDALSWLISKVTADPRFKRAYPGILDEDGNLRMKPSEWKAQARQYRNIAAKYGYSPTDSMIGRWIAGETSPAEAEWKAQMVQQVRHNAPLLQAVKAQVDLVNQRRRAKGQKPIKSIASVQDAVDFLSGGAPAATYAAYEAASISAAAQSAGISVDAEKARRLAMATPGIESMEDQEKRFHDIAAQLRTSGAELSAFGLTQNDLMTIQYGGAGRVDLASKAERAMAQAEAQREVDIQGEQVQVGGRPQTRGFEPEGE